jgi:hypothetical protein
MSSTSSSAPSEVFGGFCSLLGLKLERFQFQIVDLLLGRKREALILMSSRLAIGH